MQTHDKQNNDSLFENPSCSALISCSPYISSFKQSNDPTKLAGGPRGIFLGSCGMSVAGGIGYGAYLGWKAAMRSEKLKMRAEVGCISYNP